MMETGQQNSDEQAKYMGEGAQENMMQSVMGMPLQSVVTFGRMTREQLDGILKMLNGE